AVLVRVLRRPAQMEDREARGNDDMRCRGGSHGVLGAGHVDAAAFDAQRHARREEDAGARAAVDRVVGEAVRRPCAEIEQRVAPPKGRSSNGPACWAAGFAAGNMTRIASTPKPLMRAPARLGVCALCASRVIGGAPPADSARAPRPWYSPRSDCLPRTPGRPCA